MPLAILINHKEILTLRKMDSSADLRSIYLATKSWRSWSGCVLSQRAEKNPFSLLQNKKKKQIQVISHKIS